MTIEFIRLKVSRPNKAPLQLFGSVVLHSDGTADFFGDASQHAEDVGDLLDHVRIDVPFSRARPEDLDPCDESVLLVDVVRIDEQRIVGPLLLRTKRPPAVGGKIDDGNRRRIAATGAVSARPCIRRGLR